MSLPEVTGYPQESELRAMTLKERLAHAHRVAMTEDKESIELAAERIAELEAALKPFAAMSGSYTHMHGAHVVASRGGTILDVNDLRRAAALVPDAVV